MRWLLFPFLLFLVNSFPFRELLDLSLQLHERNPFYTKAFIIQRVIKLLYQQEVEERSEWILKELLLERILEVKGFFALKGAEFEKYISSTSGYLISDMLQMKENGMEPPKELLDLFEGTARDMLECFLMNKKRLNMSEIMERIPESDWRRRLIGEAAAAWHQMRVYSLFMKPNNFFFKIFGSFHDASIERRIDFYLNSYVSFLKPFMHKYSFCRSMPNLMTAFYFFVYLQNLARIFPSQVSDELISRMEREQAEFMEQSVRFPVRVKERNRKEMRSIPFFGWWCEQRNATKGILIPTALFNFQTVSTATAVTPLLHVTFYQVVEDDSDEDDRDTNSFQAFGLVRTEELNEDSRQLLVYTTRAKLDDKWYSKFISRINARMHTQDQLMSLIS